MSKRALPKKFSKTNPAPHGHPNRYDNGCRCDTCRIGHRRYKLRLEAGLLPSRYVDPLASRRRIQGLVALGFNMTVIGGRMDTSPQYLWHLTYGRIGTRNGLSHVTARRIAIVYAEMAEEPMPTGPRVQQTINLARRNGWVTPEAWTEESIADPKAEPFDWQEPLPEGTDRAKVTDTLNLIDRDPVLGRTERRPALWGGLTPAERIWIMRVLTGQGMSFNRVGLNLGVNVGTLKNWLERRNLAELVKSGGVTVIRFFPDAAENPPQRLPKRQKVSLVKQPSPAVVAAERELEQRPQRILLEVAA